MIARKASPPSQQRITLREPFWSWKGSAADVLSSSRARCNDASLGFLLSRRDSFISWTMDDGVIYKVRFLAREFFKYPSFTHKWIIYFLLLYSRVTVENLSNILHALFAWRVCVCLCVYARCHCASFWLFRISKLPIMSSQNWREREEMCLTPWINIAKVRAQPGVCFIIKSSSSSVTRLNDDIVLLVLCHAWAKPVDSGNNI